MLKCNNKSLFLIFTLQLAVISCFVVIGLYFQLNKNAKRNHKQEYVLQDRNLSFDQFCKQFGEWESIGSNVFIKKSAAFYFVDLNFLRIYLLTRANFIYNFTLLVSIYDKQSIKFKKYVQIKEINTRLIGTSSKYEYSVINAKIFMEGHDFKNTNTFMRARVIDSISGNSTNSFLNIKIKY
jgi:hypothetical protein